MTSRTTNKFVPKVRSRTVRMVLEHESDHASLWAAIASIADKIGCTPETLRLWVKRAEREGGKIDGAVPDLNARLWGRADLPCSADRPVDVSRSRRSPARSLDGASLGAP